MQIHKIQASVNNATNDINDLIENIIPDVKECLPASEYAAIKSKLDLIRRALDDIEWQID